MRQIVLLFFLILLTCPSYSQSNQGLGQTIRIQTRLHSFVGKPSWLLVIRDLDHNQNLPYLYDIERGDNFWLAFTYSRNYLIVASTLQIETYRSKRNQYKNYKITNFCQLESRGRIQRGVSMHIQLEGDLAPNSNSYRCHVSKYQTSGE